MTAVFRQNATDRSGASWHDQLAPWETLEFVLSDAAKGIASGLNRVAGQRRSTGNPTPLTAGLDLFHTAREARTVLRRAWQKAEAAWTRAEVCDIQVSQAKRRGIDARGVAQTAAGAWRRAVEALHDVERQEAAWGRARRALDLFDGSGRLNTRHRALTEIVASLPDLSGAEWSRVRNFLSDPRSTAFLDRMHGQLAQIEPRVEWREAMAWRWWGRHDRPTSPADCGVRLVRAVAWNGELTAAEAESYALVSAVLCRTVRASSAVECLNSVLRMQQSRHKRMTQPMLDLKRLYWNCHQLGAGRRKGVCPYQRLGLNLPSFDFWQLLQSKPEDLTQELSGQKDAP